MLYKLNPAIIFIEDKFINLENVYSFNQYGLSIQIDYYSGDKELLQFGSKEELDRALIKISNAQKELDFGFNYV